MPKGKSRDQQMVDRIRQQVRWLQEGKCPVCGEAHRKDECHKLHEEQRLREEMLAELDKHFQ